MKKLLLLISSVLLINAAMATDIKCRGMYLNGEEIHLLLDGKTNKLNINGMLHDIVNVKKLKGKNYIVWSENYVNDLGEYIYIALKFMPPHAANLMTFNVATQKVGFYTDLSCYKLDN